MAKTLTGLFYEGKIDLKTFLNQQPDYKVGIIGSANNSITHDCSIL